MQPAEIPMAENRMTVPTADAAATAQPAPVAPMQPVPPTEQETKAMMRGGRSDACPGRFCFIIPCPIPCDFCII